MRVAHYSDRDCTGSALINGTARGRRAFFLDQNGWLRGVTYRQVWLPGENIAQCLVTKPVTGAPILDDLPFKTAGVGFAHGEAGVVPVLLPNQEWARCEGLDRDCACGFYAYHSAGGAQYGFLGPAGGWGQRATAVVEGYGKVIVGRLGYRASKARVVAVNLPTPSQSTRDAELRLMELMKMRAEAKELLDTPMTGLAYGTTISLFVTAAFFGFTVYTGSPAYIAPAAGWALAAGYTERKSRQIDRTGRAQLRELIKQIDDDIARMPSAEEARKRFRENYPDVDVYENNAEQMFKDWPVESLAHLAGDQE